MQSEAQDGDEFQDVRVASYISSHIRPDRGTGLTLRIIIICTNIINRL